MSMNQKAQEKNKNGKTNGKNHQSPIIVAVTEAKNSLAVTLANLSSNIDGLQETEAKARLVSNGPNEVARDKPRPALLQFMATFKNPFILVLTVLAIISFITDYWLPLRSGEETEIAAVVIIATMIILSALLRFWQEYRSTKAAMALRSMVKTTATVVRRSEANGKGVPSEIPVAELVVGDIIMLSAGDMIPADVRLVESRDLFISQSVLTGEALPVEKYDTLGDVALKKADDSQVIAENPLDQHNICFMGTNVVSGTAKAIVVATGSNTYFGSLAKSIVGSRAQTSFDRGVNSVSWLLIRFMLVMVPIVFLINGISKGDWGEAFLI